MDDNIMYLRECMRDSWSRGELPFASHLWGPFFLNEHDPEQRKAGIEAGYQFWDFFTMNEDYQGASTIYDTVATLRRRRPLIAFYTDHGISSGMALALERTKTLNREYEIRVLPKEKTL